VAVAAGAINVEGAGLFTNDQIECVVLPVRAGQPIGLFDHSAALFARLSEAPLAELALDSTQVELIEDFEAAGIASRDLSDPFRNRVVANPWLLSPMHELVYALVAHVCRSYGVRAVFIKGPILREQGLRDRRHSGDVDVLLEPGGAEILAVALKPWGWSIKPDIRYESGIGHSITLQPPSGWGCEIDLHTRWPGLAASPGAAFDRLYAASVNVAFGGTDVKVPNPVDHAVIAALHQVRPNIGQPATLEDWSVAEQILSRAQGDVGAATAELRASAALSFPDGYRFSIEPIVPINSVGQERCSEWTWLSQSNAFRAYFAAVSGLAPGRRLKAVYRLVWPSAQAIRNSSKWPSFASNSVTVARLRRLAGVLRIKAGWVFSDK